MNAKKMKRQVQFLLKQGLDINQATAAVVGSPAPAILHLQNRIKFLMYIFVSLTELRR